MTTIPAALHAILAGALRAELGVEIELPEKLRVGRVQPLADLLTKQARYEEAEKLLRRLLDLASDNANVKVQAAGGLATVL